MKHTNADIERAFEELAKETGMSVEEIKSMSREEFDALVQGTIDEMMDAQREVFALKTIANEAKRKERAGDA